MLMDYFQRGGPVMYPLLACSIVALTVLTERLMFWMRIHKAKEPETVTQFLRAAQQGRYAEAYELGRSSQDPALRVLVRGVADRDLIPTASMEQQARAEVNGMTRYLVVLETVISLAPLLGIYGTITGILRAFGFLSAIGVPDPRLVAAGIAEALITTVAGLTIAITAIPFHRHFLRRMECEAQELEQRATTLELILAQRRPFDSAQGGVPSGVEGRRRLDVEQTEPVLS
jgi:biopolymer transport protein ExbB